MLFTTGRVVRPSSRTPITRYVLVNSTVTRALLGEAFPLRATVLGVMDELHRLQAAADLVGRRRRVALGAPRLV